MCIYMCCNNLAAAPTADNGAAALRVLHGREVICPYIYVYVYKYVHILTRHIRICGCRNNYICIYVYLCIYICCHNVATAQNADDGAAALRVLHGREVICISISTYICICIYMCINIYLKVYINVHMRV